MTDTLHAVQLGSTPYREGLAIQDALVARRASVDARDWLLFPDHPPVLTVGRRPSEGSILAAPADLARLGIECFEVPRGGDVTWHGPGQLVAYPIVELDRVGRDLHRYLRELEEAVIRTLACWAITAQRIAGRTGVWVSDTEKIASIGVAVRRWVGYHGVALNVSPSLEGFDLIHPCGLHGVRMTSMERLCGDRTPALEAVREAFAAALAERLGYAHVAWTPAGAVRELVGNPHGADTSKQAESAGQGPLEPGGVTPWSS